MTVAIGAPWPGALRGEVISPSGRRSYLAAAAASMCGRSTKWATNLARTTVESEQGHVPGRQGGQAWFLLADSFEEYLQRQDQWPPRHATVTEAVDEVNSREQLLALQGADLEAARRENEKLRKHVEILELQRNQLLDTVATLTQLAKTPLV